MFTLQDFDAAAEVIYRTMAPTPQYAWPLLAEATGAEVWVKHENMTPTGAFKVRGGILYMDRLMRAKPDAKGVASATRGNHGQSLAFAARRAGIGCTIIVPMGNSPEKNAAMRGFGAEVIEAGDDFDAAKALVAGVAAERGYEMVPSFAPDLVLGVGTYARELFTAAPDLDTVYVPIGLGSGICGVIEARDAMGLDTKVVGVVTEGAPAYARSFEKGEIVVSDKAETFADGVAVRGPSPDAFDIIRKGADRVICVPDSLVAEAIRTYFSTIHAVAEGAGAVPLAGLLAERDRMAGRKVGVILSGQNIDMPWFRTVLEGGIPCAA